MIREMKAADLIGLTFSAFRRDAESLTLTIADTGQQVLFYHDQDCCEDVYLQAVIGDLKDLLWTPIVVSEEASSPEPESFNYTNSSHTWTFYKLRTAKGDVTLRFLGESNGYYSESISIKLWEAP